MKYWNLNGTPHLELEKSDVILVAGMLEPLQIEMKKAVTAMDYGLINALAKKGEEITKSIKELQKGEGNERSDADGPSN